MSLQKRLKDYNAGANPNLLEFKFKAMRESAFRFYRGTCHLFAEDFAKLYKQKPKVKTWICGDLHFENFGSYKADNRMVYFDVNDFDEAILGSPEPELTRFITSIIVGGTQLNVPYVTVHKLIHDIMETYVNTLSERKSLTLQAEVAEGPFKNYFLHMSTLNRPDFIATRTVKQKGALLLKTDGVKYLALDESQKIRLYESLEPLLNQNPRFSHMVFEDAACRISGTGSLGLNRYGLLFYSKKKGKHYLIDVKQARASCYEQHINWKQPRFKNEAERIITLGYLMQFAPPAFNTPLKVDDKWYVVKELQPQSDKMSIQDYRNDHTSFSEIAREMASIIAYAHLRSSGHYGSSCADDLIKFAEKKQWQKDVIEVSGALAKKNEKYYKTFCK